MNVLVLQSFLAVLFNSNCSFLISTVSESTVSVTPTIHGVSIPAFELFADWNMAEAVTVIPWDLKEAYYCLTVCWLLLCVLLYLPVLGITNKDCT